MAAHLSLPSLRSHSKTAKEAKQLWEYLVHQEDIRESFIHYIFTNKVSHHKLLGTTALWSVAKVQCCSFRLFTVACCLGMRLVECSNYLNVSETFSQSQRVGSVEDNEPECRVVYKDSDSIVSSFCINSVSSDVQVRSELNYIPLGLS